MKQQQETPEYRFEVSGTDNREDEFYPKIVNAIKIIDKKTGAVQLITLPGTPADSLDNVVQVQDCNFDGYPDFWIFAHTGGAGPNDGNHYYFYDPKDKRFVYNQPISDLTQVEIDSQNKTITSAFRDGCCHHGGKTYTFKNGRLDAFLLEQSVGILGNFYRIQFR